METVITQRPRLTDAERAERKKQGEERMARKISQAQERDTRVVVSRTVDTHVILDIVRQADRGIQKLRSNLLIRYLPAEVMPLLEEYYRAIEDLNNAAEKICVKVEFPYRTPRNFQKEENKQDPNVDTQILEGAAKKKK